MTIGVYVAGRVETFTAVKTKKRLIATPVSGSKDTKLKFGFEFNSSESKTKYLKGTLTLNKTSFNANLVRFKADGETTAKLPVLFVIANDLYGISMDSNIATSNSGQIIGKGTDMEDRPTRFAK